MDKWKGIIDSIGLTGSKADWMSQYTRIHHNNESLQSTPVDEVQSSTFPTVLPMAMKVAAQTVGLDLVSVVPMNSNTTDELESIKAEVAAENRERKIDSVIEGKDYEEMKLNEHPDFNGGPRGELFYLDYSYGGTQSEE